MHDGDSAESSTMAAAASLSASPLPIASTSSLRRPRSTSRAHSVSSVPGTPTTSYSTFSTSTPPAGAGSVLEAAAITAAGTAAAGRRSKSESRKPQRRWSRSNSVSERRATGLGLRRPRSNVEGGLRASSQQQQRRSISQALLRAVAGDSETEEEFSDDEMLVDGQGRARKLRRSSTIHFLAHPSAYTEVIATYSPAPRVSAVIRSHGTHSPNTSGQLPRRRTSVSFPQGYGNIPSAVDEEDDEEAQNGGSMLRLLEMADKSIPYGVRKMEILSRYMTTKPYIPIYVITLFTSLSSTTTPAVEPFLLSTFGGHAYISSIAIVTSIAYAVCKPPMAKILDTFGRAEGLAISAILYGIGFLLVSSSSGIVSFAAARVLGSAGAQGINLAQQVIVADITSLASRALVTSTIFLPWLLTPWLGPPLGQVFKDAGEAGYRTAYTLFGVAVPVSCLFLLFFLWNGYRHVLRTAKQAKPAIDALKDLTGDGESVHVDDALTWQPRGVAELAAEAREELDLLGIFYLMVGTTLFLLPLSLAATSDKAWRDPLYPGLVLAGLACLGLLGYHEACVAAHPLIPTRLLRNKTVMSGCLLGAFHFFCQFAYESYFPSFLQVARSYSARDASYIAQSYVFSASIAALGCGLLVKWSRRYKIWMILGILLHMVGAFMMVRYRSLDNTTFEIVISQVIGGLGGGFTTLGAQLGVQSVVSHQDVAIVTAVFLTITQIGGAVGGAASGALWSTFLKRRLTAYLPDLSQAEIQKIFGSMAVAISYEQGTPQRAAINQAYVEVQRMLNLTALLGLLPALVSALMMKNVKLSSDEDEERIVDLGEVLTDTDEDDSDDRSDGRTGRSSEVSSVQYTPVRRSKQ